MSLTSAGDMIYAFRFLRLLTQKWEETEAYKQGVIDANGTLLKKKRTTREEKESYTLFHRLVFNMKRMMEKFPGGKSRIASYAAALFLIRENTGLTEKQLMDALESAGYEIDDTNLTESWLISGETLGPGKYTLVNDIASPVTGEVIALKGTTVSVQEDTNPTDTLFNAHIYEVKHVKTRQNIYITVGDIKR